MRKKNEAEAHGYRKAEDKDIHHQKLFQVWEMRVIDEFLDSCWTFWYALLLGRDRFSAKSLDQ